MSSSSSSSSIGRKKLALCVGINNYPGADSDLAGCVNDARDWAAKLQARGFHVDMLLDEEATKERILAEVTRRVEALRDRDEFVPTFSGHGTWAFDTSGDEADQRDEAWVPHDIMTAGPILDDELYEIFAAKKNGARVIMISDSCHSGTMARFAPALTPPSTPTRKARFLAPEVWVGASRYLRYTRAARAPLRSLSRMGALVLAGCKDDEYSYDAWFGDRPGGAFTVSALRALETQPELKTYRDWHQAIRKLLPSSDYPQTPQIGGTDTQKRWKLF